VIIWLNGTFGSGKTTTAGLVAAKSPLLRQSLVAPQTVLEESYWDELVTDLRRRGHRVFMVLLEAEEAVLRRRIEAGDVAVEGRLRHLPAFASARPWMAGRADLIVDSTDLAPEQVADRVWESARPLL
jgi:hypothetical protein